MSMVRLSASGRPLSYKKTLRIRADRDKAPQLVTLQRYMGYDLDYDYLHYLGSRDRRLIAPRSSQRTGSSHGAVRRWLSSWSSALG